MLAAHLVLLPASATRALTATLGLPASSAEQRATSVSGAPTITGVTEGDRLLQVAFQAPTTGPSPLTFEYSTDNGATWRARTDAAGTTSPLEITTTSTSGDLLANGTTYPVRLRAVSADAQGAASARVLATPRAPAPPPGAEGNVRWLPVLRPHFIEVQPDSSAITFTGAGERRALVDMEPTARATIELTGTQFTQGNGWGVIVHGGTDGQDRFEGYTVQMDRGFGSRVVVRHWRGGGEHHRPIAQSDASPVTTGVHNVRVEVDGVWLRVLVDDIEVLVVPDLPEAVIETGSSGTIRTDGVFGLRLWSSTDLVMQSATLSVG